MLEFDVVVAADEANGIGRGGTIPWRLSGDLARFRALTTAPSGPEPSGPNAVVMGRKTWDSLPERFRPLPGRLNVVVSRNAALALPPEILRAGSLDEALTLSAERRRTQQLARCFVIGGAQIYRLAIARPECRQIHLTRLEGQFDCDVFLEPFGPELVREELSPPHEEAGLRYWFERWARATDAT